jgi:hypothetical protein
MELANFFFFELFRYSSRFDEAVLGVNPRPHHLLLIVAKRLELLELKEV